MASCEKLTLIERIVSSIPGPYIMKCIIYSSIFGVPFLLLTRFLDTSNAEAALELFGPLSWPNILTFSFANFALLVYALIGIRYMRSKLSTIMPVIEPIIPKKSSGNLDTIFKPVCKLTPPIIVSLLLIAVSVASFPDQGSQHSTGLISLAQVIVAFPFTYFAYGTFIWVYASSINGLHQLGRHHLHFVSFYEDSHLGMKSLGSLSLSLAWVYFFGTGLVFFSANPVPTLLILVLLLLLLLGVALFFLPLRIVHGKMVKEKRDAERLVKKNLAQIVASLDRENESSGEIADLLAFQLLEQKVSKISEWPFDTITLSWFSAIVITILGTIITRYLLIFLGL